MRKAETHCRAQGTGPSAPNCGRRAAPESGKAQKRPNRLRLPPSPTVPVGPVPGPLGGSGRGLTRCSLSSSAWAYMMADFQVGSTTSWRLRGHPKLQMFGVDSPQTWVIESDTYFLFFFFLRSVGTAVRRQLICVHSLSSGLRALRVLTPATFWQQVLPFRLWEKHRSPPPPNLHEKAGRRGLWPSRWRGGGKVQMEQPSHTGRGFD